MLVEIWSDVVCPWCYIGKRRFERALAGFEHRGEVEVRWRSFELDPYAERHPEGSLTERLAAKYGVSTEQARDMHAQMTETAAGEGLEFHFERAQTGNTFDAHRLIHLAAAEGKQDAMKERLMRAYFTEGAAISDVDTLARLAAECGIDPERARTVLESDEYAREVRADEERAMRFGIQGVPFFAIDERYGVSGAQPSEVLLQALQRAWSDAAPVGAAAEGEVCGPDGCPAP